MQRHALEDGTVLSVQPPTDADFAGPSLAVLFDGRPMIDAGIPEGTVALSDLERRAPQIFRSGADGDRPNRASRTHISVGQGGRLTAWCDRQPEDLLQRNVVDP